MDSKEKKEFLGKLSSGWELIDGERKLMKDFVFKNFADAMEFAYRYGKECDLTKHHPDLLVRWQLCQVLIWSHNINDVTERDFQLAQLADKTYQL